MKLSKFEIHYTWADLEPVRILACIVIGAQIAGGLADLAYPQFPKLFVSIWVGAALCSFPGFLVGLIAEARLRPGSITANRVMVRHLGLIALVVSGVAVAKAVKGFGP